MLARCRVHEVSQEWGCEWGSSYMNESIHSVSSHDCRFLPSRMRGCSLLITLAASRPIGLESQHEMRDGFILLYGSEQEREAVYVRRLRFIETR